MKITVNPFDPKSIDSAIQMVKQYKRDFEAKESEFLLRLSEIGVRVAQSGFATADYDGVNDVVVSMERTNNGYSVVASGKTVGFIEFGTGVKHPEWDNTGMDYTPPKHGTYGKGHGADLDNQGNPKGWWFASGRHTYGNTPAEAMRTARDEMVENVIRIAREVWR
jgi:hypothetical protein